jgi:phosphonoacetaldehyde hydrolase
MLGAVNSGVATVPETISAVIFDWAGTVLDFGCIAPVAAFREAFDRDGLEITEAEARLPMGAAKREHIKLILAQPDVKQRWEDRHGVNPQAHDVDRIYARFLQVDTEISASYSALIPGALEAAAELRNRGILIGSTTGYPRSIMDKLVPLAEAQGYQPDCCITADDVKHGRPWPDMLLANVLALGVRDVRSCVVVDDSPGGLVAARAAGMWAIGVAISGNEVGLSQEAWEALDGDAQAALRDKARAQLAGAGAHHIIDSVAQLIPLIDQIERDMVAGARP